MRLLGWLRQWVATPFPIRERYYALQEISKATITKHEDTNQTRVDSQRLLRGLDLPRRRTR